MANIFGEKFATRWKLGTDVKKYRSSYTFRQIKANFPLEVASAACHGVGKCLFLGFAFAFALGIGGQLVGQGFVAANRAGILARPFAVGDGVLQTMPSRHFRFPANDTSPFFGPAKLPFLLPRNRQICELVHDLFARVFVLFFLLTFFHILTVKLRAVFARRCIPFIVKEQSS